MEKKGFILFTGYNPSSGEVQAETKVRHLAAGTEAETVEECYFLVCSQWISQCAFLIPKITCGGVAIFPIRWIIFHQ